MRKSKNFFTQRPVFALFYLFVAGGIYGFNLEVTEMEAGFLIHPEYNLNLHYCWDTAVFGTVELNKLLVLKGGIAAGRGWDMTVLNAYGSAEYRLPFFKYAPLKIPLSLKTAYLYNGLPAYETHIHTLLPSTALTWRYLETSAGYNLRFTFFADDPVLFEPILAYSLYVNVYHTEDALIGIGIANFDDFAANNLGSYFFRLNTRFRITRFVSVSSELKIDLSGNVGCLTSVYGISCREGIIFSWR